MRNAIAAALLLLAACDYDPGGRCTSSRDCLSAQVCAAGLCTAEGEPPPNNPPAAAGDAYTATADVVLDVPAAGGVLQNDADPDGDPLSAERVAPPAHGVVYVAPDGAFVYVPHSGFTGDDAFTYRACDGALRSDVTTVTLTVGP